MSNLVHCIVMVEAELVRLDMAGKEFSALDDWEAHRNATKRAEADAVAVLTVSGAKIRRDWNGAVITLSGLRSSSTSGLHGALQNWVRKARECVGGRGENA